MARPRGPAPIKLDPAELLKWAKTGATQNDIADKLGVSLSTLERSLRKPTYRQALQMGRGDLCVSLRARQVQAALSGNVQMLKWLGEQYLGQATAHRFVDKQGEDKPLVGESVLRDWIRGAPAEDGA